MASRITQARSLLPEYRSILQAFTHSSSKFRIVRTINPTSAPPKTLYILDSSFNPPSKAHLALATSAIRHPAASDERPFRLLLLFSTHNADKAPSPASFEQRMVLMTLLAEDLSEALKEKAQLKLESGNAHTEEAGNISIDIGLTKEPYYTDKSTAIAHSSPPAYPSNPVHVHLVGYDTLIRFCNPKYYQNYNPPLSALTPFFEAGHKLRVTQRPYDANDASSTAFGTVEDQHKYLQELKDGKLEEEGFKKAWAHRIDMVPAEEGIGISSTRVRRAAKEEDWELVRRLCTEGVAAWVQSEGLYAEDASGQKMMS
ncbi:Nucleotidylyl transferase [Westerdykella ornata]|uniref:Nucleotidylyl transferase n=1 Tax=Westerdykella ornata TaxID=318751 RepID=A0A6A6JFY0_WESOR|nr:Nucleotidylyl transferase [Westerdykella ornata]KAF2275237.1 Nucleotidylyl transferase [Westerdykella ornata]